MKVIKEKVRPRLIADVKEAHKLWSVRLGVLAVGLEGLLVAAPDFAKEVWLALPEDMKASLPDNFVKWVGWALIVASVVARLVKQKDQTNV